jgi:tetratricopeptide (TPR) repeat protein
MLATNAPLVCLHPSLDYCLEWYAARPRGSVVRLFPRDADKVSGRALDAAGVAANDHYWQQRWTHSLQTLAQELTQPTPLAPRWASRLCQQLRLSSEPTRTLTLLAAGYSRCLDSWGVSLQRAGQWPQAGLWFQRALELNPANLAAQINSEYNQRHQRGDHARLAHDWVEARFVDQSARFRSWTAAVEANGPVDEPTSLFTVGATLVGEGKYVQAARDFGRCADLAPDWLDASIGLAQIRVLLGDYQGAFSLASNLESSGKAKDDMDEAKIVSCRAAALKGLGRGQEAVAAVEGFAQEHHERAEVLSAAAQLYLQCGRFAPALALLDQLLAQSPNDPSLLLYKGSAEIGLAHFPDAIATLTKALTFAPASPAARINRAIACLRSGQLDAARDDYEELLQHFPNSPPVLFGLGEIAWRRQDTNAAIGLYERYLASTALGSDESKLVSARLKSLRGP